MPNLTAALNDQIRRLSKREVTTETKAPRRQLAQHRRDIAALKRQVVALQKTVALLERQEKRRVAQQPVPVAESNGVRFRADGLRSQRARLGLSAGEYGRLIGVSAQSIYYWEQGKAKPRQGQVAKLVAVRGLGKREIQKRLDMLAG